MQNINILRQCPLKQQNFVEVNAGKFMYWSEQAREQYQKAIVMEAAKICAECPQAVLCEPSIGYNGVKTEI